MSLSVKLRSALRKSMLITNCYHKIHGGFIATLYSISPVLLARYRFRRDRGRSLNLINPQCFDEKLFWLMLYWRHPLKTLCGDKYTIRAYVEAHGLGHILPELWGVYEKTSEIDFGNLPERFVLKCTHGCGFNIICIDKGKLDIDDAKRRLDKWLKKDFSKMYGEIHYSGMKPRIVCERYLDDLDNELPCDYKVYCFNGKAHFTMACTERELENHRAKYDLYDREWKNKLPYSKSSMLSDRKIPKPVTYEEIIEAAEILSKPFPFVRVDFYSINGKTILGEMTFTPAGCIDAGYTDIAQYELGKLIKLPEKLLEIEKKSHVNFKLTEHK